MFLSPFKAAVLAFFQLFGICYFFLQLLDWIFHAFAEPSALLGLKLT